MYPLVISPAWLTELLTPGNRRLGTETQIRSLVRIGHEAGHIEGDEEQLIHRAFVLNERSARDIMTPIGNVRALAESRRIGRRD